MPTCGNPECGNEIPEGKAYCDEACLGRALKIKKQHREPPVIDSKKPTNDSSIEAVLKFMGIEKTNFAKDVAYRHWERFVQFLRDNSGKSWEEFIKPRLRSYIGIDYRYLEGFLKSCLSWGVVEARDGNLYFIGLPKEASKDAK